MDRAERRVIAAAIGVGSSGVLAAFMTGAISVQVGEGLGFGSRGLGLLVASFFLSGAITSVAGGRLSERLGPIVSQRAGALWCGASLVVAAAAVSFWMLLTAMVLAGLGNAIAQPAANLSLSRAVPSERQGFAFAVKQSGIPTATLLGGIAVPLLVLSAGWRWAYVAGVIWCVGAALLVPDIALAPIEHHHTVTDADRRGMWVYAFGVAFAAASANAMAAFFVRAAVDLDVAEGVAGVMASAMAAMTICVRMGFGIIHDRRGGNPVRTVVVLMAFGSTGHLLMSRTSVAALVVGGLIAFGAGWGWPALSNLAVTVLNPRSPGAATGLVQTGIYVGAFIGPIVFGIVAEGPGWDVAWTMSASWLIVSSISVASARRILGEPDRHGSRSLRDGNPAA